jgi:hypothetical protein
LSQSSKLPWLFAHNIPVKVSIRRNVPKCRGGGGGAYCPFERRAAIPQVAIRFRRSTGWSRID